jgi:hypothetical protein
MNNGICMILIGLSPPARQILLSKLDDRFLQQHDARAWVLICSEEGTVGFLKLFVRRKHALDPHRITKNSR